MTIEVVQAIILRGAPGHEKVLVVKEKGGRSRKLPGGTVDTGEDYATALVRELNEELTGFSIKKIYDDPEIKRIRNKAIGDTVEVRRYRVDISTKPGCDVEPNTTYREIDWVGWISNAYAKRKDYYLRTIRTKR